MNSTIATFMAIDTAPEDSKMEYSMLGGPGSADARRGVYWKNVITWGATARRCYPEARVVVATNDPNDLDLGGASLYQTLDDIGIERLFAPYALYKPPPRRANRYINLFYRFDALCALLDAPGPEDESLFLTDSDVVWVRRVADLDAYLPQNGGAFNAPHRRCGPHVRYPHNMSRADTGDAFRRLDPAYPEPYPTRYGTDFIGGRRAVLRRFMADVDSTWQKLLDYTAVQPLLLPNGENIMENDEHLVSFILNLNHLPVTPADGFFLRLFTLEYSSGRNPTDTSGVVWHVPQEKQRGMRLLYDRVMDRQSDFWTTPVRDFADYLGPYLGVPTRKFDLAYTLPQQIERHVRMVGRGLRRWNMRRKLARELKQ